VVPSLPMSNKCGKSVDYLPLIRSQQGLILHCMVKLKGKELLQGLDPTDRDILGKLVRVHSAFNDVLRADVPSDRNSIWGWALKAKKPKT